MRLTHLVQLVRKRIADRATRYWTDAEIIDELNIHQAGLYRKKVAAHESYGSRNLDMYVANDASRMEQLESHCFAYHLPAWVYKVHSVDEILGNDVFTQLEYAASSRRGPGWWNHSNRAIAVRGYSDRRNLRFKVNKLPSRMARGAFLEPSAAPDTLLIPTTLAAEASLPAPALPVTTPLFLDQEDGAMLGAQIEITTSTATRDPRGTVGVVYEQVRQQNAAATGFNWALRVRPEYADHVEIGDLWESHCEVEDAHIELLILLAANACFQSHDNLPGQNSLREALVDQWALFLESIGPRTAGVVHYMETEDSEYRRVDMDRDLSLQ